MTENTNGDTVNEKSFWDKVKSVAKTVGKEGVKLALILYYCCLDDDTPVWAKATTTGALLYFISPVDAIPDVVPGIGYSDDLVVMGLAIAAVAAHIKQEHRDRAEEWIKQSFRPESFPEPVDGDEKITEHTNGDTLEEKVFWDKIKSAAKGVGRGGIKLALILYYCYLDNKTTPPDKAKIENTLKGLGMKGLGNKGSDNHVLLIRIILTMAAVADHIKQEHHDRAEEWIKQSFG